VVDSDSNVVDSDSNVLVVKVVVKKSVEKDSALVTVMKLSVVVVVKKHSSVVVVVGKKSVVWRSVVVKSHASLVVNEISGQLRSSRPTTQTKGNLGSPISQLSIRSTDTHPLRATVTNWQRSRAHTWTLGRPSRVPARSRLTASSSEVLARTPWCPLHVLEASLHDSSRVWYTNVWPST